MKHAAITLAALLLASLVLAQGKPAEPTYLVAQTDAELDRIIDAAWSAYYAREIAARGLADGQCLDVRPDGQRVCITTQYRAPLTVPGEPGGLMQVDSFVRGLSGVQIRTRSHGDVTLSVGDLAKTQIPARLQAALQPPVEEAP
jgi:hypothetical protein